MISLTVSYVYRAGVLERRALGVVLVDVALALALQCGTVGVVLVQGQTVVAVQGPRFPRTCNGDTVRYY